MKHVTRFAATAALALIILAVLAPAVRGHDEPFGRRFEIVVTNLTRGQQFTPILAASHRPRVRLFDVGAPATPGLRTLAEEGNTGRWPPRSVPPGTSSTSAHQTDSATLALPQRCR